jgi:hypothetical protein
MDDKRTITPDAKLFDIEDRDRFVEGNMAIYFRDDDEKDFTLHHEKHNLIVNLARKTMAHSIGDCTYNGCITQFRLGGDNTLDAATLLAPASPQPEDTTVVYTSNLFTRNKGDLVGGIDAFEVSYPDSPDETSALFSILIGKTEANVQDPNPTVYVCAGLFSDSGAALFASQSFPVLTKTPNREFLIQWEIRF